MGFRRYMSEDDASLQPLTPESLEDIRLANRKLPIKTKFPQKVHDDMPHRDGKVPTHLPFDKED